MDNTFNIMSIDPGSRIAGLCIYTLKPNDEDSIFDIVEIKTFNMNVDIEKTTGIHENILDRSIRLAMMVRTIYSIYKPAIVAMESAFINMSRMGAVIPLAKSIHSIETAIYKLDKDVKIISIPPGVIKKVFNSSQIGKDAVKKALMDKPKLLGKVVDKNITEHEIDAIAIGYTLMEYLKGSRGMVCIKYLEI